MPSSNGFVELRIKQRSPWRQLCDTVLALYFREMQTRFGEHRFGLAMGVLEPIMHICIFSAMYILRGKTAIPNVSTPLFILAGIMPFLTFRKIVTRSMGAASANKGLFGFARVKPFHAFLSRNVVELNIAVIASAAILMLLYLFDTDMGMPNPGAALFGLFALVMFSAGLGLACMSLKARLPMIDKVVPLILRPLYFASGIFFTGTMVPVALLQYVSWNPIFVCLEYIREGLFHYASPVTDPALPLFCAVASLAVGSYLYRKNWQQMLG